MQQILGSSNNENDSGEHWLTVSDLMAGLMMVFLFIAIVFMLHTQRENQKITNVAVAYQENQVAIYEQLQEEFSEDLDIWGARIDPETLSFDFQAPEVLFASGKTSLRRNFKQILDNFFPRYLEVLKPYRDSINEVRIEGHTSSEWNHDSTSDEAYFNNMALSQGRTRTVLHFVHGLVPEESAWIKRNVAAVGLSSSKAVLKEDGSEDTDASRRVSFRVVTNADIEIKRILEAN